MARDVESLVLRMSADIRAMEKQMAKAAGVTERRMREIEQTAIRGDKNLRRIMGQAGEGMVSTLRSSLAGLAPTLAAAFSAQAVIRYADAYTSLQNRLKAAGLEGEALKRVEDQLFEAANRNGVAIDAVAAMYQRVSQARQTLGATDAQLIELTNGVTAALRVQGVSAEQASGPLLQLGQALGAGTVRAEELNSLLEGTPVIIQAAARGSREFAGDTAKLAAAIRNGEVSSREFFAALLAGLKQTQEQAADLPATLGQALTTLNNQLGRYIGATDSGLSATQRLAQGIEAVGNNLDKIMPAVAALVALIGLRYTLALTANSGALIANAVATARLTAFQTAMTASMTGTSRAALVATGAMARLNAMMAANPIGAVIVAVSALAAGFVMLSKRYGEAHVLQRQLDQSASDTSTALAAYEDAARDAATATGEHAKEAQANVAAMRTEAITALQAAQALRVRTAALAAARAETAREAEAAFFRSSGGKGAIEARGGQLAIAQAGARTAERQAREAAAEVRESQRELARIDANIRSGYYRPGAGVAPAAGAGGGRSSGRSGSDQTAQARAQLAIEREIAEARARGDAAAVRAAEERQELAQLVRQYEAAGVEDARGAALEHLGWLNEAKAAVEAREAAERQVDDILAGRGRQLEREAEYAERATDQARDRLAYETQLARLSGDDGAIRDAERRLYIEERMLEILRLRLALTEDEARAMAGAEWAELDRTEAGRDMARGLVDLLRADSIWEEAGQRFREAAWEGIENLIAQIFNSMNGGKGGGGDWISAIASFFTGRGRATGGSVIAGQPYLVGERRPEVFVPNVSGTIIPSVNAAMAKMNGGGARVTQVFQVNAQGAILSDQLMSEMQAYAAQSATAAGVQAVSTVYRALPKEMARRQRQSFRLGT